MQKFIDTLENYKQFFDDYEGDRTDEEIEQAIQAQKNAGESLDALILFYTTLNNRAKNIKKQLDSAKKLISAYMRNLDITDRKTDDGKVRTQFYYKYDTDLDSVPSEYMQVSSAKIQGALRKGEKIPGVTPTDKYPTRIIR